MSGVPGALPVVATIIAMALSLTGFAAAPVAPPANQFVADCGRYSGSSLLDCPCVVREAARLAAEDKRAPADVIFDRAATACPSKTVKANDGMDPRYRHHTFEERRALREFALDFVGELDAMDENDAVARIVSTPWNSALLSRMPTARTQFEQRVREVLASRAASGKLTNRRVGAIGTNFVTVEARAEKPAPNIPVEAAYSAVEIVKFTWSASGKPELAEYDFSK
jgi:hypothetical protein